MNRISEIDSKVIKSLRFPLAAIVVFLHSMNVENTPINIIGEWQSGVYDLAFYDTLRVLISRVIGHLAVPTFMFVSGYLFFVKLSDWNWSVYINKIKSRVHTLLIPYMLWNIIPVVITFVWLRHPELIREEWDKVLSQGFLGFFYTLPHNAVLWFLRDLIVFVIASPIIYWCIKCCGVVPIVILIFVNICKPSLTLCAMLYFVIGSYASINEYSLVKRLVLYKKAIASVFVLFALLKLLFYNDSTEGIMLYVNNILNVSSVLFGITFLFIFFSNPKVHSHTIPKVIETSSFLIYVIHMEFLWRAFWVLHLMFPSFQTSSTIKFAIYLISPLLSLLGILALNYLLVTCMPRLNTVLTSNR